jgi:hypothetical protein
VDINGSCTVYVAIYNTTSTTIATFNVTVSGGITPTRTISFSTTGGSQLGSVSNGGTANIMVPSTGRYWIKTSDNEDIAVKVGSGGNWQDNDGPGRYNGEYVDINGSCTVYVAIYNTTSTTIATFNVTVSGPVDTLSISANYSYPVTHTQGQSFVLTGTVSSSVSNISTMTVGVYTTTGAAVSGANKTLTINAKTANINTLFDSYVAFGGLAVGTYDYKVIATNTGAGAVTLVNKRFTVVATSSDTKTQVTVNMGLYLVAARSNNYMDQLCAGFVNECLKAGGFTIPGTNIISPLNNQLRDPRVNAPAQYAYFKNYTTATVIDNPSLAQLRAVKPGDLIFEKTSEGNWCHVVIVSIVNGTNIYVAARNNSHYGKEESRDLYWNNSNATIGNVNAIVKLN